MMRTSKQANIRLPLLAAATASALLGMPVQAFEINTGNSDLTMRWDNTVKLNLATRVQGQDEHITASPNFNDGDLNFNKGAMTSERLDLFSVFQLDYKQQMGVKLSGAAWADAAYNDLDGGNNPTPNHLVNGHKAAGLSNYTNRYAHGPSGELLEAYVYRKFDFGEQKLNLSAGKQTQLWGNSVLTPLYGINYGQNALELGKLFGVPRNEQQEVYLPRNQLDVDFQYSPAWSFGAQYFMDWQHARFPEAGSYLGMYDLALDGGQSAYLANGAQVARGDDTTPKKQGDFGVYSKWTPQWLGGTLGLFYRRTSDSLPDTVLLNMSTGKYSVAYAGDIDIYGVSLTKNLGTTKLGVDLSYRQNMPLASQQYIQVKPTYAVSPGKINAMPDSGETGGARGDTMHLVLNATKMIGKTPFFDRAPLAAELTYSHLLSVTSGYDQYRGNPAYVGIDKSTRDFIGMTMAFSPTWNQVFKGVDLSLPMAVSTGLMGESFVPLGGNKNTGNYSVGLGALVNAKYQFDLKYTGFFGPYETNPNGTIKSYAGLLSLLKDRGTLSLTFKTKF